MRKIIFLDIDGTIRGFNGYIPESAAAAVQKARSLGHKVCISTGRPRCQIEQRILDIGFDGVISGSGSYVEYEGQCVHSCCFDEQTGRKLCRELIAKGCILEMQKYDHSYILQEQQEAYLALGERIQGQLGPKAEKLTDLAEVAPSLEQIENVEKLLYFSDSVSTEAIRNKWGSQVHVVTLSIPCAGLYGGELTPPQVNKAEGITSILKAGGFAQKDVIAVGDSANDIEMLQMADVGVAMGNASPEVKRIADLVTAPLEEDGIYHAFKKLNLI